MGQGFSTTFKAFVYTSGYADRIQGQPSGLKPQVRHSIDDARDRAKLVMQLDKTCLPNTHAAYLERVPPASHGIVQEPSSTPLVASDANFDATSIPDIILRAFQLISETTRKIELAHKKIDEYEAQLIALGAEYATLQSAPTQNASRISIIHARVLTISKHKASTEEMTRMHDIELAKLIQLVNQHDTIDHSQRVKSTKTEISNLITKLVSKPTAIDDVTVLAKELEQHNEVLRQGFHDHREVRDIFFNAHLAQLDAMAVPGPGGTYYPTTDAGSQVPGNVAMSDASILSDFVKTYTSSVATTELADKRANVEHSASTPTIPVHASASVSTTHEIPFEIKTRHDTIPRETIHNVTDAISLSGNETRGANVRRPIIDPLKFAEHSEIKPHVSSNTAAPEHKQSLRVYRPNARSFLEPEKPASNPQSFRTLLPNIESNK